MLKAGENRFRALHRVEYWAASFRQAVWLIFIFAWTFISATFLYARVPVTHFVLTAAIAGSAKHSAGIYDSINRDYTRSGGDGAGNNLRFADYTANNLNELIEAITPGYKDIMGLATAGDTVMVNSSTTSRKNDYFDREITISNGSSPVCQSITINSGGQTTLPAILSIRRTIRC